MVCSVAGGVASRERGLVPPPPQARKQLKKSATTIAQTALKFRKEKNVGVFVASLKNSRLRGRVDPRDRKPEEALGRRGARRGRRGADGPVHVGRERRGRERK